MNSAAWAGVVVPEFRAGDTVFSGRPVAEVLHESGIELIAKVSEYDRAHLNAGQKAEVTIHAVQGKTLPATIKDVAGASRREVWAWNDPTRTFDVSFEVTGSNPAKSAARPDDAGARHGRADQGRAVSAAPGAVRT